MIFNSFDFLIFFAVVMGLYWGPLRRSVRGQNLLLLSKYSGLDPERATGIDSNFYPLPRTVTAGLNIGF